MGETRKHSLSMGVFVSLIALETTRAPAASRPVDLLHLVVGLLADLFDPPRSHLAPEYLFHWIGMDVGVTNDPSEIMVFGETRRPGKGGKKPEQSRLELIARISLHRVDAPSQARLISRICEFYRARLKTFAIDATGLGLPIFQILQDKEWGANVLPTSGVTTSPQSCLWASTTPWSWTSTWATWSRTPASSTT